MQACLVMSMAGAFFLGVLWRRTNPAGGLVSLATVPPAPGRLATTTLAGMRALPKDPLEEPGRGLRDYRLWLGLVVAVTTALFGWMR